MYMSIGHLSIFGHKNTCSCIGFGHSKKGVKIVDTRTLGNRVFRRCSCIVGMGSANTRTMITNSKQNWQVGQVVKVGFMSLKVTGVRAVVDGMPDIYSLTSLDGKKQYEFVPHNGLCRID